jgi:hypothetical protein
MRAFLLFLFLAGCTNTATVTVASRRVARANDCQIQVITQDSALASNYELVGTISMTVADGSAQHDETVRKRIQPRACALGGEAVSPMDSAGTPGMAFQVWASRAGHSEQPKTWGAVTSGTSAISGIAPAESATTSQPAALTEASSTTQSSMTASAVTTRPAEAESPSLAAGAAPHNPDGIPIMAALGISSHHLGIGLGVRAGKAFANRVYVGGAFVYHLGQSTESTAPGGYTSNSSFSAFYLGPEAGYDFRFVIGGMPLALRAYAGLGVMWLNASGTVSGPGMESAEVDSSSTEFVFWPGATLLYDLPGSAFFAGVDLRFVTVPAGPATGLFAAAGTRF